jgi:hypothetical protein
MPITMAIRIQAAGGNFFVMLRSLCGRWSGRHGGAAGEL